MGCRWSIKDNRKEVYKKKKKKDNRKEQALSSKGSNIPQEPRPTESL